MPDPTPTLGDIPPAPFVTAPPDATVRQALAEMQPEQVLVVMAASGRPLGVLTHRQLRQLAPDDNLADIAEELDMPTLAAADTPLTEVLRAMRFNPLSRWQVLMSGDLIERLIDYDDIFAEARQRIAGVDSVLSEAKLFGDPNPPVETWYQCTGPEPHCVPASQVRRRTPRGRPYCPCDDTLMDQSHLCAQSTCQE